MFFKLLVVLCDLAFAVFSSPNGNEQTKKEYSNVQADWNSTQFSEESAHVSEKQRIENHRNPTPSCGRAFHLNGAATKIVLFFNFIKYCWQRLKRVNGMIQDALLPAMPFATIFARLVLMKMYACIVHRIVRSKFENIRSRCVANRIKEQKQENHFCWVYSSWNTLIFNLCACEWKRLSKTEKWKKIKLIIFSRSYLLLGNCV